MKAPPYIHSCGSNSDGLPSSIGTIPYTSLLYSSTNQEVGGLDISTGVFTAPHGGSYTVYWDISASLNSGNFVVIYLQKNGESIEESRHYSEYNGPSGNVYDQGKVIISIINYNCLLYYRRAHYCCLPGCGGHSTTIQSKIPK